MALNLSAKSSRYDIFRKFAVNVVRARLKDIDANDNIPLSEAARQRSFNALDLAISIQEAWADVSSLLVSIAPKMERSEHRNEWKPLLKRGVQQSKKLNDVDSEGELSFFLGMLYLLSRQWKSADDWFKSSRDCFEELKDNNRKARALNRLAHNSQLQRNYKEANEYVIDALHLLGKNHIEQEYSYFVLGRIVFDQRDWKKAESYFRKSLAICKSQNNKHRIGQRFLDIGVVLDARGRFEEALDFYKQSLFILNEVGAVVESAIVQMNQGIIYSKLGDVSLALDYYKLAKPVLYEVQDVLNLAHLYTNQAFDYYHLQRWNEAEYACKASIQYYEQLGLIPKVVNALDGLGLIYIKQGYTKRAHDVFYNALMKLSLLGTEDPSYQHLYDEIQSHLVQVRDVNY